MRINIQGRRIILTRHATAPGGLIATVSDIAVLEAQRNNVQRQIGALQSEVNAIMAEAQARIEALGAQSSALRDEDAKLQGELRFIEKLRARSSQGDPSSEGARASE